MIINSESFSEQLEKLVSDFTRELQFHKVSGIKHTFTNPDGNVWKVTLIKLKKKGAD
jgi:hypothetical protein